MEKIEDIISTATNGNESVLYVCLLFLFRDPIKWLCKKFGSWVAEGANRDFINKAMPELVKAIGESLKPIEYKTKLLEDSLEHLSTKIKNYTEKKHEVDGENCNLKEAILLDDPELLKKLRELIQNEKR